MQSSPKENILVTNSDLRNLAEIRDFVYNYAFSNSDDKEFATQVSLAVDEVCSNLIKYAYKLNTRNLIEVKIQFIDNSIKIEILDNGENFNILEYQSPSLEDYYSNYMRNGLGITIVKSVIDEISYTAKDSYNSLTLIKYRK